MTKAKQFDLEPKMPKPRKKRVPVRTQASSFDPEIFDEVQTAIGNVGGFDSGIPEDLDAELLGQNPKDAAEENYQRGQEMATMIAMTGWQYAKESLRKMVDEARREHEAETVDVHVETPLGPEKSSRPKSDEEILQAYRDWKAMDKAVKRIIANIETAAATPHPDDLAGY